MSLKQACAPWDPVSGIKTANKQTTRQLTSLKQVRIMGIAYQDLNWQDQKWGHSFARYSASRVYKMVMKVMFEAVVTSEVGLGKTLFPGFCVWWLHSLPVGYWTWVYYKCWVGTWGASTFWRSLWEGRVWNGTELEIPAEHFPLRKNKNFTSHPIHFGEF